MIHPAVLDLLAALTKPCVVELDASDPTLGLAFYAGLVERAESSPEDVLRLKRANRIAIRITDRGLDAAASRRGPCTTQNVIASTSDASSSTARSA